MEIDKTELAWRLAEHTGANLFITGKAGTGKTTFLKRLKGNSAKTIAVLAPTGIAALNAGGMTIHSFFQLSFSPFIPGIGQARAGSRLSRLSKAKIKVIRSLDMIVIDEISMVRADVLDAIDAKLRKYRNRALPFGGVQLVMIGDMQQLPPVVKEDEWALLSKYYRSPYFFDSITLRSVSHETIELTKVYRQKDAEFLNILNAIRDHRADNAIIERLNTRFIPSFNPPDDERYIRLMTHNSQARLLNESKMEGLPSKPHVFKANIEGDFPEMMYPAEHELILKEGAQVMFIKNDPSSERRYYNGLIGKIISISSEGKVYVSINEGEPPLAVAQEMWENTEYSIDNKDKKMKEKVVGRFYQIPLRPAWAITIHKSQGLTFDKAIINASYAFVHGQTYVALSRCRNLEGLVLEQPLSPYSIICDSTVTDFIRFCSQHEADNRRVETLHEAYLHRVLFETVNFSTMEAAMETLHRILPESHGKVFPKVPANFGKVYAEEFRPLAEISSRFLIQLKRLIETASPQEKIRERMKAACDYFIPRLELIIECIKSIPLNIDNKGIAGKFSEAMAVMDYEMRLKNELLKKTSVHALSSSEFLKIKRDIATSESQLQEMTDTKKSRTYPG